VVNHGSTIRSNRGCNRQAIFEGEYFIFLSLPLKTPLHLQPSNVTIKSNSSTTSDSNMADSEVQNTVSRSYAIMDVLPAELIILVFEHLWHADIQTFLGLLRSCKTLHRLVIPILYKDLCIHAYFKTDTTSPISTVNMLQYMEDHLRSLTVTDIASIIEPQYTVLEPIWQVFPRLSGLKTFSINNTPDHYTTWLSAVDVTSSISYMLTMLPLSVVNLEVILNNVVVDHRSDICDAIATLLPRLHTLRLFLPSLCRDFLRCLREPQVHHGKGQISSLQCATIWTDALEYDRYTYIPTKTVECTPEWGFTTHPARALNASSLSRDIKYLHNTGHFPKLQHFCIVQFVDVEAAEPGRWNIREVVSDSTLTVPCEWPGPLRLFSNKKAVRDHQGARLHVDRTQLAALIEPVVWMTLPNRGRVPCDPKHAPTFESVCRNLLPSDKRPSDLKDELGNLATSSSLTSGL